MRRSRLLTFLGVLILHAAAVIGLLRSNQVLHWPNRIGVEPLVFFLLPKETPIEASSAATAAVPAAITSRRKRSSIIESQSDAINLPTEAAPPAAPTPAAPTIDWDHEAQLAADHALADIDKGKDYRNLAGLSAEQLKFVRDNHLLPMAPGIVWAHPRVEVDPKTLIPIIHINDHCVLVLLIPFCGIGHIRPNDHLFEHMHDRNNQ